MNTKFDESKLPADSLLTFRPSGMAVTAPIIELPPTGELTGETLEEFPATAPMPAVGEADSDSMPPTAAFDPVKAAIPRRQDPQTFAEKYTLKRLIGSGGFGEVWDAHERKLSRRVALKRLRATHKVEGRASDFMLESFRQEALASAALDHPNIVPIYELIEDQSGDLGLSMKLVEGRLWDRLLNEERESLPRED